MPEFKHEHFSFVIFNRLEYGLQGSRLLKENSGTRIKVRAWMYKYAHIKQRELTTRQRPSFDGGCVEPPLKLGHRRLIIYQPFMGI